jgi:hypothetical protein
MAPRLGPVQPDPLPLIYSLSPWIDTTSSCLAMLSTGCRAPWGALGRGRKGLSGAKGRSCSLSRSLTLLLHSLPHYLSLSFYRLLLLPFFCLSVSLSLARSCFLSLSLALSLSPFNTHDPSLASSLALSFSLPLLLLSLSPFVALSLCRSRPVPGQATRGITTPY